MSVTEIVAGWRAGTITDDAYVWRDGWDDWLPVLEVPELKAAIEVAAKMAPGAKPAGLAGSLLASKPPAGFPPAAGKGTDEFVEVDIDAAEDEPSAGAPPNAQSSAPPVSASPQSVSLQALKAEMQPAGTAKKATGKRGKSLDEMLGLGGPTATPSPLLALGTADLATAPAPPTPKPEPKVVESMPAAAPASAPRTGMVLLAMLAAMLIGGLAVALFMLMNQQKTAANTPAPSASEAKTPAPSAAIAAPAPKTEEKTPQPATSSAAADAPAAVAAADTRSAGTHSTSGKPKPPSDDKPTTGATTSLGRKSDTPAPKAEPAVTVTDKPSAGLASFDKRAALASLQTVTSQATACRRLDGPKGSGKALVTFAPSGRVTGVTITGGNFQGTKVGSCVAGIFRRAKVPSFSGDAVTVAKAFTIPN